MVDTLADLLSQAADYDQQLPPPPPLLTPPLGKEVAMWIDHTLLKPDATSHQIKNLCHDALKYHFAAVCVNPAYVLQAQKLLVNSGVAICTVIGFPLGATLPTVKAIEALSCLQAGATEIDMVLNIGALKSGNYGLVLNEIQSVVQIVHNQGGIVKVILETALLSRQEKIIACLVSKVAGADFVKTSTGFGPGGASIEDVGLMCRAIGPGMRVKASGGIRNLTDALMMIQAGATRIGTSAGVTIVEEARNKTLD